MGLNAGQTRFASSRPTDPRALAEGHWSGRFKCRGTDIGLQLYIEQQVSDRQYSVRFTTSVVSSGSRYKAVDYRVVSKPNIGQQFLFKFDSKKLVISGRAETSAGKGYYFVMAGNVRSSGKKISASGTAVFQVPGQKCHGFDIAHMVGPQAAAKRQVVQKRDASLIILSKPLLGYADIGGARTPLLLWVRSFKKNGKRLEGEIEWPNSGRKTRYSGYVMRDGLVRLSFSRSGGSCIYELRAVDSSRSRFQTILKCAGFSPTPNFQLTYAKEAQVSLLRREGALVVAQQAKKVREERRRVAKMRQIERQKILASRMREAQEQKRQRAEQRRKYLEERQEERRAIAQQRRQKREAQYREQNRRIEERRQKIIAARRAKQAARRALELPFDEFKNPGFFTAADKAFAKACNDRRWASQLRSRRVLRRWGNPQPDACEKELVLSVDRARNLFLDKRRTNIVSKPVCDTCNIKLAFVCDRPIRSLSDLRGRRVAFPGNSSLDNIYYPKIHDLLRQYGATHANIPHNASFVGRADCAAVVAMGNPNMTPQAILRRERQRTTARSAPRVKAPRKQNSLANFSYAGVRPQMSPDAIYQALRRLGGREVSMKINGYRKDCKRAQISRTFDRRRNREVVHGQPGNARNTKSEVAYPSFGDVSNFHSDKQALDRLTCRARFGHGGMRKLVCTSTRSAKTMDEVVADHVSKFGAPDALRQQSNYRGLTWKCDTAKKGASCAISLVTYELKDRNPQRGRRARSRYTMTFTHKLDAVTENSNLSKFRVGCGYAMPKVISGKNFQPKSSKCRHMFSHFDGNAYGVITPRAMAMSADGMQCGWCVPGRTPCFPRSDPVASALKSCQRNAKTPCKVTRCVGC